MDFSDIAYYLQALAIAATGGIVAALYKFSKERKRNGSTYDSIDFMLQSVTASFAGVIGFLLANWRFDDYSIVLALTGLASTGGYPMLIGIKDSVFQGIKQRLGGAQKPDQEVGGYSNMASPLKRAQIAGDRREPKLMKLPDGQVLPDRRRGDRRSRS